LGALGPFLTAIGGLKASQTEEDVEESCRLAAKENRETGVAVVFEHSDWPGSRRAMTEFGIEGLIFQEVITLFSPPQERLRTVRETSMREESLPSPHALYTVEPEIFAELSVQSCPLSTHLAESSEERAFFLSGTGSMADRWRQLDRFLPVPGRTPVQAAHDLGFLGPRRQAVHACALDDDDIALLAATGSPVAHCPRSNVNLGCPPCPVRRLRRAGVSVGIGMDSAASGGAIDMFAEMREARSVSLALGEPLEPEEVWLMACEEGLESMLPGHQLPWIGIRGDWSSVGDVLDGAESGSVFWL
jgi:5-methylthioadenosine/S-adenosylhomocysteine deaminase